LEICCPGCADNLVLFASPKSGEETNTGQGTFVPWPVALLNGHESGAVGFLARIDEVKYNVVLKFV
jgi:hypothetical protein